MKVYIINLERSSDRKMYMLEELKKLSFVDPEFISAVDGRVMTEGERKKSFDEKKFHLRYSIEVRPGEIGCTLSHQKCYKKMLQENEPYVLILEDDIALSEDVNGILQEIEKQLRSDIPQIILLSGWYWYYKKSPFIGRYRLANVYDGFLTHSYIINHAAAERLIEEKPYITADDWRYIRKKGIRLQAVLPHLIDQKWDGSFATTINIEKRKIKSWMWRIRNLRRLLILKLLYVTGNFEKA